MSYQHRLVQYPRSYAALSILLALLAALAAAWQFGLRSETERDVSFASAIESYVATLEGGTTNSRAMGAAILFGLENQGAKQVALGKLPPDAPAVLSALETLRTLYFANTVILVNTRGKIVAYRSMDHAHGTGKDLSFRPYVQMAMQGTPNVYPAVGTISTSRGIFLAAPLRATMSTTSKVIGAVVIKVGADKLDALLNSWTDGTAVLLSPQGVVFAANRNDWLLRVTGKSDAKQIAELQRSRQFGNAFDPGRQPPLPITLNTPETSIDGVRYAVRSRSLDWNDPAGDWTLGLMERRASWWSSPAVWSVAALVGLFAGSALFWLYALARNAVLRQENYLQLESAQKRLLVSEAKLRAVLDNAPIGIWLTGVDGRYHFVNRTFCEATGICETKLLEEQNLADAIGPEAAAICVKSDHACLAQDEPYLSEETLNFVDGKSHLLEVRKVQFSDDAGETVGVIGTAVDVTMQRMREQALRESEEKYREFFEYANDYAYSHDEKMRFTAVNNMLLSATGYTREELIGISAGEILTPENQAIAHRMNAEKLRGEQRVTRYEMELTAKDGRQIPVEIVSSLIYKDGQVVGAQGIARDISERKMAEQILRTANEKVAAASRAKSEFLANMSHELRTPMNSILGMAHLGLNAETDPKKRGYLEKIHYSGTHLLNIIDEILDFSKLDARKLKLETVDFNLGSVLDNLHNMVAVRAMEKGLKLEFDIAPDLPSNLRGDPRRLSQVLINYVSNAIKFTATGNIVIRARTLGEHESRVQVRFEVRDSGIGISDEDRVKLFQPFQQVDASNSRNYGGTGLGLAISRQLVEMMDEHEGEVGVDSALGQGSTFWFTLRLGKCMGAAESEQENGTDFSSAILAKLSGARILLAENNLFNQQVAIEFIENAGASVCVAQNGEEAIDLLLRGRFDCVLMDIQMPIMDGFEATRLIRANPELAEMPVIAMTANASDEDRALCLAAGMDDYISKPFKPHALYATLAKWLQGRMQHAPFFDGLPELPISPPLAGDPNIIDLSILSELIGDDPLELRRFLTNFLALARKDMLEIEVALQRNDVDALRALGHHNKSPARMVGAIGFSNLCQALEDHGKNGEGLEQVRDIVSQMRSLLERINEQINKDMALAPSIPGGMG